MGRPDLVTRKLQALNNNKLIKTRKDLRGSKLRKYEARDDDSREEEKLLQNKCRTRRG